jgi:hypothetical protein
MRACNVAARATRPPAPPRPVHFAPRLAGRADAGLNFVRTGGRVGHSPESSAVLRRRTNYFRATYVSGVQIYAPVTSGLLHHPRLAEAARELYGRPIVVPATVYANVMLPGQELGLHTDVPEFRGAHRGDYPLWLLVVLHHSGLFERWRIHLATGVLHLGWGRGGEFAYYPDGIDAPAAVEPARHNRALVLDTDSVFHGVDRVLGDETALHRLVPGSTLRHRPRTGWSLERDTGPLAAVGETELRYSISWKARCFADPTERRAVENRTDDLDFGYVLRSLTAELVARGRLAATARPSEEELAGLMISEFIHFPR